MRTGFICPQWIPSCATLLFLLPAILPLSLLSSTVRNSSNEYHRQINRLPPSLFNSFSFHSCCVSSRNLQRDIDQNLPASSHHSINEKRLKMNTDMRSDAHTLITSIPPPLLQRIFRRAWGKCAGNPRPVLENLIQLCQVFYQCSRFFVQTSCTSQESQRDLNYA